MRDSKGRFLKGNIGWNRGRHGVQKYSKVSEETRKKQSESLKKYLQLHPRKLTPEWKANLWRTREHKRVFKSEETKKDCYDKIRQARLRQILPVKDTSIEVKMQNWLISKNIEFEKHKLFMVDGKTHRADLYLPSRRLVIECDGDYWHSRPKSMAFDRWFSRKLLEQGTSSVRLRGSAINACSDFQWVLDMLNMLL